MAEVIVVEDRVDEQCVRHVHLMSNECDFSLSNSVVPIEVRKLSQEGGVWHLQAEYPFRGVLDVPYAACREGKVRRLMAWNLDGCGSVREAIGQAGAEFERLFCGKAQFAFMRKLPRGAENGMDIGELTLFEVDWLPERCVAVGGRDLPHPIPLPLGEGELK